MTALLFLVALQTATLAQPDELTLTPVLMQDVVLFLSDEVTSGGVGGGVGVQLLYRQTYLAQLDVAVLWSLGNATATRLAIGVQRHGQWTPAGWLTLGALWGDRLEFLSGDGRRPAIPSWSLGIRGSPLRFTSALGVISALEPGIGTDLNGGLWLELTVLQAGVWF
jgi:hypothetical protein